MPEALAAGVAFMACVEAAVIVARVVATVSNQSKSESGKLQQMWPPFLLREMKALPFPPGGHPRTDLLTPCSEGAGRLPRRIAGPGAGPDA